jgi:hypothetical protein
MTPVTRPSSLAHKVQPNHGLKLRLLESLGDRRPTLFQNQTKEFSKILVNHSTHYIYTINNATYDGTIHVNHCKNYTYINNFAKYSVNHLTSYTYTKASRILATTSRYRSTLPNHQLDRLASPNPSPASLRVHRQTAPTLDFTFPTSPFRTSLANPPMHHNPTLEDAQ